MGSEMCIRDRAEGSKRSAPDWAKNTANGLRWWNRAQAVKGCLHRHKSSLGRTPTRRPSTVERQGALSPRTSGRLAMPRRREQCVLCYHTAAAASSSTAAGKCATSTWASARRMAEANTPTRRKSVEQQGARPPPTSRRLVILLWWRKQHSRCRQHSRCSLRQGEQDGEGR